MGRHDLTIAGIAAGHDVTEVRYNGSLVTGNTLRLDSAAIGQSLTIVVDDKPATISGTVIKGDNKASKPYVVLVKWPMPDDEWFHSTANATGDDNGQFQFGGPAPGEYRIVALTSRSDLDTSSPIELQRIFGRAPKIELSPGNSRNVQVELTEMR